LDVAPAAGRNTLGYESPINVVVTPRGKATAMLGAEASIGPGTNNRPEDVTITVTAQDQNSNPVGGVRFYWRCLVPISSVVG
jgi:hypothetical protein